MTDPIADTPTWPAVRALVAWLDQSPVVDRDTEKILRCLKLSEEVGEVASAIIGTTGQNPRKGVTHTWGNVRSELCDVIVTGMVALATLSPEAEGELAVHLAALMDRAGVRYDTAEPAQWAVWSYVHGGWRLGGGYTIDVDRADRFTAHKARALIDDEARDGMHDGKPRSLMMLGPEVRTADDDVTVMNTRLGWAYSNEMRKYGADGQRSDLTKEATS